ncbi:putative toxin biosynthesis cytochrome P450 monooxygenase [Microthyrium microscopicum]|uniref:Putative toxin biosynthesis cytochrome P450 monooxygenase n=1 Tax=Microthyrium microscopicum TaxID=703497 RepID=A0A6A6U5X4_9PEZI|nr:putative toxin biosynthesis cytochrome P450 monooxygenase [Microthyrium microscopicum]
MVHSMYSWIKSMYFHPLSKFPGPKIAAASSVYQSAIAIRGLRHIYSYDLHERYGPIVRTGPHTLSFTDEDAWRDIYTLKQGNPPKQLQKSRPARKNNGTYSVILAPDDVHARQRRVLSHAFSEKYLRDQEPLLQSYVALLITKLSAAAKAHRPIDATAYLNYLTFDLIGELAFSAPFDALANETAHPWMTTFFRSIRTASIGTQLLNFRLLLPFVLILVGPLRQGAAQMFAYAQERIDRRIEEGSEKVDFMAKVLESMDKIDADKMHMTRAEVDATFNIIMVAGSETTATALAGAVYLLAQNPEAMEKLQKEIRGAAKEASELTMAVVNGLPYLFAVLEEVLRIYPPVPVALARTTPPEGATIAGQWVPGGFNVGVPQFASNHSARNFYQPEAFLPERWMASAADDSRFVNDKRGVVQPFSTGPRNCIGKNLAYAEMKLALAHIIYAFDFDLTEEAAKDDWLEQSVYTLWEKKPLMVRFKEVQPVVNS